MQRSRTTSKGHKCKRCPTIIVGQAEVCNACRAKALLCQKCEKPHGGPPATTKFCPKCRASRRVKKGKYPKFTAADDRRIRAVYETHFGRKDEGATRLLAREMNRPVWAIRRRATKLGLVTVRMKEPHWSEAEVALLQQIGWQVPEVIARKFREAGFHRTATSIAVKLKRLRVRETIDGATAHGLADLMGIDVHAVCRWIERGWLEANRTGAQRKGRDVTWYITTDAIRRFLRAHPEVIDFGKIERAGSKAWLLEMLTGAAPTDQGTTATAPATAVERTVPLYGERVTIQALADISGRSVEELLHRLDGLGLSVIDAAFGPAEVRPVTGTPSDLTRVIQAGLRALMKRHRASPRDVGRWTEQPESVVRALLDGAAPLIVPAVERMLHALRAEVRIEALS